ncbi:hypothetical protein JCM10213_003839 [Rhodosporidiobolus nylandii]
MPRSSPPPNGDGEHLMHNYLHDLPVAGPSTFPSAVLPSDPSASRPVTFSSAFSQPSRAPHNPDDLPIDLALAGLSRQTFPPPFPSAGSPFPPGSASTGPAPSSTRHYGTYDIPSHGGDGDQAEASGAFPMGGNWDGDTEFELPTPPSFGLASSSSGQKGKGKARAPSFPDDIAVDSFSPSGLDDPAPSALSAKAQGKRRARSSSSASASFAGPQPYPYPARSKPRNNSLAAKIQAAGGLDKVAGRRMKVKGLKGQGLGKKGVVLPLVPELFRFARQMRAGGEPSWMGEGSGTDEATEERLREELKRAKDPAFAITLLSALASHQDYYDRAYKALNDELVKAQIEESVLNNVKSIVVERRDEIRRAEKADEAAAAG